MEIVIVNDEKPAALAKENPPTTYSSWCCWRRKPLS